MRQPKPWYRKQTKSWYVQIGKEQINLGHDKRTAWATYHQLMTETRESDPGTENAVGTMIGNYLKKEDLAGETLVTLVEVRAESVPDANRKKLVVQFAEFEKPLILNSTNIKRLSKMFGTGNTAHWRGPVTLYVDENVEYAGTAVGGIRVRPATRNGAGRRPEEAAVSASQADGVDIF
jgi:hypothetical protein